ncbi:helix-turn-helix domain-containing protein [Dyadobacter arcticus]|uniref:Transcriptional regulator with XRE-family HTH domain n=1 Tax=Dyadobacter arcticus TaxID=1078754 RepID=A0ABX0US71_9BACT|nr:helix-turn-helix transcriptional regulator [Dyadobacter arcticus]NIJ55819.1 transcriptional regulator with XRE-family HTH domain [Dyadobacter arcticus]
MTLYMTFGTRLRQLREKNRLSQQEVADYLGIGQSTYSQWESDQTTFKVHYLLRLSELFAVDISQLVPRDINMKDAPNLVKWPVSNEPGSKMDCRLLTELLESKNEVIKLLKEENERLKANYFLKKN